MAFALILKIKYYDSKKGLFCFAPPPNLVSINFLSPQGARAIFLHSNVLYNNIQIVTGGHKNTGGGETELIRKIIARAY